MTETIGIAVGLIIHSFFIWCAVYYGTQCSHSGYQHIKKHKRAVNWALVTLLLLIIYIEFFVQLYSTAELPVWILYTHLVFAAPYFLLLVAVRFFFTGEKIPTYHHYWGKTVIFFYSGTIATGILLLLTLNNLIFT